MVEAAEKTAEFQTLELTFKRDPACRYAARQGTPVAVASLTARSDRLKNDLLPDSGRVGMGEAFLKATSLLPIKTSRRRGAHATGGETAELDTKHATSPASQYQNETGARNYSAGPRTIGGGLSSTAALGESTETSQFKAAE